MPCPEFSGYRRSRDLYLSVDLGFVKRWIDDTGELEFLGFVGDPDACPPDRQEEWAILLDEWRDSLSFNKACLATANDAWWRRFAGSAFLG